MLKEKEKRTLLIVILGVALVSLIVALISGVISGLLYFVNGEMLDYTSTEHLEIIFGLFLLAGMSLGVTHLAFYLKKRNYLNIVVLSLSIAQIVYFLITTLVLYIWMGADNEWDFYPTDFSMFETYVAAMLSILIPSILIMIASHFLHKSNQKEAQLATAETGETGKTAEAAEKTEEL